MNRKTIWKAFDKIESRGWDRLYWAIDIHDTIVEGNYSSDELATKYFPDAKETLQMLTKRADCVLILFTCCHQNEIDQYLEFFKKDGIEFKYVNSNPEVPNTTLGCFDQKFYTNLYLEDKAGFDGETDWSEVKSALQFIDR